MQQHQDLRQQIETMEAKLDPTSGLPLNRQELAAKLSELGTQFDNARTQREEAKLVKRGVEVAVKLKERTAQMGKEGKDLKSQAAGMYQQHFSEEEGEESAPAAPAPAAGGPAPTP